MLGSMPVPLARYLSTLPSALLCLCGLCDVDLSLCGSQWLCTFGPICAEVGDVTPRNYVFLSRL